MRPVDYHLLKPEIDALECLTGAAPSSKVSLMGCGFILDSDLIVYKVWIPLYSGALLFNTAYDCYHPRRR